MRGPKAEKKSPSRLRHSPRPVVFAIETQMHLSIRPAHQGELGKVMNQSNGAVIPASTRVMTDKQRLLCTTALAGAILLAGLWAGTVHADDIAAAQMKAPAQPQPLPQTEAADQAQADRTVTLDLPTQNLSAALVAFSNATGIDIVFDGQVPADKQAPALKGEMTAATALNRLLSGTGITWTFSDAKTVALSTPKQTGERITLGTVSVEGAAPRDPGRTEGTNSYTGSQVTVGSKTSVSVREVPQSVSVVTRQKIEDRNYTGLQDAMKETTGMTVGRFDSAGYFTEIYGRGFPADSFLLDGAQVEHDGNLAISFDAAIYDRFEVLRGPAGLFQGNGEPGSSINLVRKHAERNLHAKASATAGSWETYRGEADVNAPLVDSGRVRTRFVALYDDRKSYIDIVGANKFLGYGTLEVDLTDETTLSVGATYQKINAVLDQGLPAYADGTLPNVDRSTFTGADWNSQDLTSQDVFVEVKHRFDNGGHAQLVARTYDRTMLYRGARASGAINAATGDFNVQKLEFGKYENSFSVDGYTTLPFEFMGQQHNLVVGGDYRDFIEQRTSFSSTNGFTSNIFAPTHNFSNPVYGESKGTKSEEEQFGTYGQLRIKPLNRWTMIFGGRATWWQAKTASQVQNVSGEFTPYVATVVDLTNEISAYGSYASIFKPQSNTTSAGEFLDPRTGNQYEVGLKGEFMDGRLVAHAAAFRINDENRAITDPSDSNFSIATGKVRSQGVEFEVSGSPLSNWEMVSGYAYTFTEYLEANDGDEGSAFAAYTPKHSANIWARYTFPDGTLSGLSLAGGGNWRSRFYSDDSGVRFTEDGYVTVSAQIGYRLNDHFSGTFTVDNLLDETYFEKVSGSSRQNFYGAPRSFMFNFRGTF
ncbi:MAG TPA: TonB-dependent siderophore receptor [Rhodospirillaceae bacterium]|nr:TonB-dependent siderophore receptor [Rhodospirillaceae bacterium]